MRVTTLGALRQGATWSGRSVPTASSAVILSGPRRRDGSIGSARRREFHWLTVSFPAELAPYIVTRIDCGGRYQPDGGRAQCVVSDHGRALYDDAHNIGARSQGPGRLECDMVRVCRPRSWLMQLAAKSESGPKPGADRANDEAKIEIAKGARRSRRRLPVSKGRRRHPRRRMVIVVDDGSRTRRPDDRGGEDHRRRSISWRGTAAA